LINRIGLELYTRKHVGGLQTEEHRTFAPSTATGEVWRTSFANTSSCSDWRRSRFPVSCARS
jgi:hypothetical protein